MRHWIILAGLALAAAATTAGAQTPPAAPDRTAQAASEPQPLDMGELAHVSGGQSVTVVATDQALNAVNTGNSIIAGSVRSGDINFSAQALSNFSGIGNFVVNTGANNNLQGNLSVTVVAAPAALR